MKNYLRYSFVALMAMVFAPSFAQEVTFDFTADDPSTNPWGLPTSYVTAAASYTNNGYTISFGESSNGHKQNAGYLIFGKQGATLSLPAFSFDVERIDVIGTSGASASVQQNIFVGDNAVSTATTGAKDVTNMYSIPADKQAAGIIYTLKILSNHNTQVSKILIWKKGTAGDTPEQPHIANTEETAYTVAKAIELIDAGQALSETVFVKGIVSQVDKFDDRYNSITYWISDDGTTTTQLQVYSGKGLNGAEFASVDDVKIGASVIVTGVLKKYNDIYEFDKNNQLVKYEAPADEQGLVWDFTQWSEETVANLKADAAGSKVAGWSDVEKAADAEAGADPTDASRDNCFWCVAEPNEDGTMSANGVVIKELKGLKWNSTYTTKRSLAIAVNYASTSIGDYAGGAYLWLGGGKKKIPCFTIPAVKAGSTITMEVESHKPAEGRGVELYTGVDGEGLVDAATKIGDSFNPTTKASNSWDIANDCDVIVYNTNGCHIYTIKIETGTATGIISTVESVRIANGAVYNLAGQKVSKDYKGIVIVNGRKVVQK